MFGQCNKYLFSFQTMFWARKRFQHKICFKPSLHFLKAKSLPTISLTTRLMKKGEFIKLYKFCLKFYLIKVLPVIKYLPDNSEFKTIFSLYRCFIDFDQILVWKLQTVNPLFNMKKLKKKKLLYYLRPERRIVLILQWLKALLKIKKKNQHNLNMNIFKPLFTFLATNKKNNITTHLKLKIYGWRLLKG